MTTLRAKCCMMLESLQTRSRRLRARDRTGEGGCLEGGGHRNALLFRRTHTQINTRITFCYMMRNYIGCPEVDKPLLTWNRMYHDRHADNIFYSGIFFRVNHRTRLPTHTVSHPCACLDANTTCYKLTSSSLPSYTLPSTAGHTKKDNPVGCSKATNSKNPIFFQGGQGMHGSAFLPNVLLHTKPYPLMPSHSSEHAKGSSDTTPVSPGFC